MRTRPPITRLVCRVFAALTLLPALIAVNLVVAPVAEAATTVNIANGDVASFENAIYAANAGTPQIINLAAGGDYVLTTAFYDSYVANFSGLPEITGDVTIHGNGATIERSTAATDKFGILDVAGSGTLKIDTTTITGGNNDNGYYKNGGGIYNNGTLIVTNCTISNNSAPGGGGGIYNYGSATVIGSTIANNTAGSTASNSAGGGFDNVGSAAIIANSTIIGNFANYGGGGISSINNMSVINSTITGNTTSDFGDGILGLAGGVVTVTNSIVAGNGTVDVYGTVTNGGHNLIGGNPLLNPLASNGGPTQTMSLQSSSPAIDAGDDTICAANPVNGIDQRGYSRPAGLHCDIGAYEYGASISPTFTFDLSTLGSKTYGDASFSVAGYATEPVDDTGAITFVTGNGSVGCSVTSDGTVTITGATSSPGACIIEASLAAAGDYTAAGPISQSFGIAQATPTLTWSNPADITYGTALGSTQLNATASVAGTFSYTPDSGTILNAGANQSLSVLFTPTDTTDYTTASTAVKINVLQASQTINFTSTAPISAVVNDTYTPVATGGASGAAVTFGASGACSYDSASGLVTMTSVGTCTVTADQAGNSNYTAASQATQVFSVGQATASIALDSSSLSQTYDGSPHPVTATTSPTGLSYSVTYDGSSTAPTNAGNYSVVATITDPNYSGSDSDTLVVAQAAQVITFTSTAPTSGVITDTYTPTATGGSSGNPVAFGASGACTYDSGTNLVTMTSVGTCTVTADQAGSTNYAAALQATQSFSVSAIPAGITLDASLLSQTYDGSPHPVTATTTPSGLSYSVTYDGSSTAPTNAGSYTVVATITDANYTGSDSGTLNIAQAAQTITFGPLADKLVGDAAITVSATGGASGNAVTFGAGPVGVCSSSGTNGSTISIDGVGTCSVTADQAGNSNYTAASQVIQSFAIAYPNVAPNVAITAPAQNDQVLADFSVTLSASFTDPNDNGDHTCSIDWGDGSNTTFQVSAGDPSTCDASHTFAVLGSDTITVTVTDQAGLKGSASVSFTIDVTPNSLQTLTKQFETNPRIAREMNSLLSLAQWADSHGLESMKRGFVNVYIMEVNQQRGRTLTSAQADTLIYLVSAL